MAEKLQSSAQLMPKIVVIVGPTASGKSALAIEVAKAFGGEIVCADSRTVYKGMNIGTAKPIRDSNPPPLGGGVGGGSSRSIHELFAGGRAMIVDEVPHWGIDLVEPDGDLSVSEWKAYAEARVKEILARNHLPIIVGGTGLWVRALIDDLNMAETPPDPVLRKELEARTEEDLYAEYKRLDPEGAEWIDRDNKRRLVRALEVTKKTGKPFSAQLTKGAPRYDALQIGIEVSKDELARRIDERVDTMIAKGLFDEVRGLSKQFSRDTHAATGIGYREILQFIDGKISAAQAVQDVKTHTRQYAKRQMTWFKKDPRIIWIDDARRALPLVTDFVGDR